MRLRACLFVFMLLPLAAAWSGDKTAPDPQDLLLKMADASAANSFHGLLVYGQANSLDAMEVVRLVEDGRERVFSLTGQPREMLRTEDQTRWVLPREHTVVLDQGQRKQSPGTISREQITQLPGWYEVEFRGGDRVAGRNSRVVDLRPRDDYRYGYRLWLDEETGLLLRSECRDRDKRVLEHFMYVQLEFDQDVVAATLQQRIDDQGFRVLDSGAERISEPDNTWLARDLPPGFRLLDANRRKPPGADEAVLHFLYGDGLAAVSVYVTQTPKHELDGYAERGNTRMVGRTVDDHHVTVVGEVPRVTVERVLKGIGPEAEQ